MSNCTLKVKDPTLKYFLGSDSFDSYQMFRNHFVNKVSEGIIPIGNVLESVSLNINGGYTVGDYTFDTIDSLINNSLGGLLETENPDIQFNKFLQTFEIFKVKYESEPYISNKDKEEDNAFISSLIEFYENYPVSDEFKQSNLYGDFLSGVAELKDLLLNQQLDNEEEPHYPTNESELYESSQENKPYIYTKTVVYDSTTKPVLDGKDELSIVRHNFNAEIERLIGEGRQFFIRLEKDGATNVQTITQDELSQKNISWGVIGVVYELVSGEFKRVYIQDYSPELGGDVQITTDVKKAKSLGKNDVKGFTLTIPNMNEPWYSAVNPDVREAFIFIRESISENNPSPFYKINEVWKEYPVATKWNKVNNERVKRESRVVTLREFLNEQKGDLRISTKTEGINYAGNLYVQFPKGRAVLDRKPLNDKWKERVYNLVNHVYLSEENIQDVVDSLNRLLEFKGGDVSFSKRGNRIVVRRKSKRTKINDTWIYQRIKEEIKLEELFDLLDYARINVDKSYLENSDGLFPIVTEKGIKLSKVNWYDFYLDHHETIARQIKIKDKYYFEPIKSLVFNLESAQMQKIKKEQEQLKNPKLGDIELSPDAPIDTTTIINALQSIVNQVDGSTKDVLSILKALLDNNEVRSRLEDSVVTFSTKEGDKFKGVSRDKTIIINWNLIQNPNLLGQVLAEEIVHTLTVDWLTNNSQDNLSLELDELVKLAPQGILDKFGYSNNDPRFKLELLGKLGDPEVAKQLQGVKTKDKTLYDRIIDIIKEILDQVFGLEQFKKGNPTLYKELIVKLVEVSTKQPQPKKVQSKDEWEGFDLENLEFDLGPLGYDQSSLDSVLQNEKPSFLKELIKSLDADLFQYIYAKEKIGEFVTGELDFTTAFKELFNNYVAYVKLNRDNITEDEKKFYKFLFQNRDLVLNYWLENTESLKVRKPKKGEQDPPAKDISVNEDEDLEPIDSNEPNDPTEIGENEKEEREQELSEINGGEEVNSNDKFFERTGTELSSLESADKLARIFVKMIPKIERNEEGTKIYSQADVDKSTHPDWFVKIGDNRFVKYSTNVLGRPELCDYTSTWNSIAMTLADKLSLEEMLTYIDNHPELANNIPEIFIFRERLRKEIKNTFDFELYSKIETSFKRAFVGVFVVLEKDGIISLINESADIVNPAKRMFNSALVNSIQDKLSKYYIPESGKFKAKQWLKDIGVLKENEPNLTGRVLLKEMGLFLHPNTIWIDGNSKGNKTPEYQDFENQMVLFLKEFEEVPVTIADFLIKGTKNVEGLNNWFKKLFELEHKNRTLSTTTMVTNAEGEKQSVLSVFNSILQYRKHYNDSQTLEQLNQLIPRTKNDMFEYSLTKSILFPEIADEDGKVQTIRSDRKVLVDIFSGWKKVEKGKASQGNLTIDLPDGDWIRLNFIGMLKQGIIENTRAETASTSYTFRLSSWDSSVKKMTPFSFADIDSQWNRENNQINISSSSNIFRVWNNYLKGELTRIQKQLSQGKLPKDIKFGLFKNILVDSEQKTLLAQVEKNISIDEILTDNQELVLNALNRFFQSEIEQYSKLFETEMGGIESIIGKPVFDLEGNEVKWTGDNVIRNQIHGKYVIGKHEKDLLNQYKAFFVLNSLTLHTEETVLFQGDLSETPKYFKRAKGVQSTGTPLSKSQQLVDWVNSELGKYSFANLIGKGFSIGDKYQSATIVDDVKSSYYYDKGLLKEGFILSKKRANELSGIQQSESEIVKEAETLLESYSKTNIGDGDGFILADMYFALLQLVGNITQEQIIGHKALVLDAKKNASKYGLGKDQILTEEEENLRQEGLKLLSEGKVIFPKLKVTHRGNTEGNVIQKEIMDKFALFPLYPQFVYDKPAAKAAMLAMMQEGIGYIKFESGTKIDNAGKTNLLQQIESGQTEISFQDSVHRLQTEYLREQIKTPHKVKEKNTFGTQFRKLITAIQDTNLRKKWEELNQKFSSFTKKEILGELGITETEGKWDFSNVNKAKVAQVLLKEAKRRSLPENIRSFFDKYRRAQLGEQELIGVYDYLESSFGAQQIQSLLAGLIKKISIQKLKGAQLVQVSQSLFDRQITVEGKTRELGFYHFKGDRVQAAECKVAMQGDFKNLLNLKEVTDLLNKEKLEDNELTRTQVLNKLLQSDEWVETHKDVLTTIGYRIPTQGFNSMEVMVIREFLPSFHGNTIVCPPEITTQSGTDYDYDKLSIIFPSIGKNGKLDNKGSKGVQNEMIKTASDILLAPENYYKLITPNSNDLIFGALKGENGLLSKLGISTEDPKFTKIITFLGNLFKFRAVKGKNLLGIAAVWNPFTVLIQNHKWTLNSNYNKVVGFGKKAVTVNIGVNPVLGGSLESYQPNTQDGTSKLEIISQLINVTVDMPSDDTFGQTIFSRDDFGALTYAISMLGYNLNDSLYFFHQPIIYKFKSEYQKNLKKGLSRNLAKLQAISDLLGIPIPTGERGLNYTDFEIELYDKLTELESKLNKEKINKIVPIEEAVSSDYFRYQKSEQQKAVLSHYIKLLDQASQIRTIQSALNFDTSPDNNLQKTFQRGSNYKQGVESGIINKDSIDEIKNDSVISGLYVSDILESLADVLFPIQYGGDTKLMYSQVSENFMKHKDRAYQQVTNDFLLSIVQNFGRYVDDNIDKSLYEIAEQYLIGDKKTNLIRRAKEIKEKFNKEGVSYRLLDVVVLDLSKERYPPVFNPQIFMGLENSPEDKDQIAQELRELIANDDPKVSNFAKILSIVGLIQSGWSKSPIYFSDMLPEEFVTPLINNALQEYTRLSTEQQEEYKKLFVTKFINSRGGTLGKKNNDFITYLKEPHRLIDYRTDIQNIIKLSEVQEKTDDFIEYEEIKPEPKSELKTQDEFKYYGAMYTIELKDGKAMDVTNLQKGQNETGVKFQERKNKIINAYNTNPDVDPQSGKRFRNFETSQEKLQQKPIESSENFFEFKDGYRVKTKFTLNKEQQENLYELEKFVNSTEKTITLSGSAGTGKSTLISIFNEWLERKKYIYPKYSAPTHRANAVTKLMNPKVSVYTLHSLFGLSPDLDLETANFDVKKLEFAQKNKLKIDHGDILIIDESSMISDSLFEFIQSFQESLGLRVIYIGDVAQLKPVKQKEKSKVFTSTDHKVLQLIKVERTGDNAVLEEATNIRNGLDWNYQTKLNKDGEGVVYVQDRSKFLEIVQEEFQQQALIDNKLYFRVLAATNNTVSEVNQAVRKVLYPDDFQKQLVVGDIIMGYDNFDYDYQSGQYKLYNSGDYEVIEVSELKTKTIDAIGETFNGYQVTLMNLLDRSASPYRLFVVDNNEDESKAWKFADYIQQLQIAASKAMAHSPKEGAQLFATATNMKRQIAFMKDIEKMDTSDSKPKTVIRKTFDYGYAHTIHKSQGGTYDKIMLLIDSIEIPQFDKSTQQELKYVGVSRARKVAYLRTNKPIKEPELKTTLSELVNHSGGAAGSDESWDTIGREFGVTQHNHYREPGATNVDSDVLNKKGIKPVNISQSDYNEGIEKATTAAKAMYDFNYKIKSNYIIRNWAQVKYSDAIYAIGVILKPGDKLSQDQNETRIAKVEQVKGGTGYAVQMAINEGKPVYVFDGTKNGWFKYDYQSKSFIKTETPTLTKNFAGIGSRKSQDWNKDLQAIRDVYQKTLEQGIQEVQPKAGQKTDNQLIKEYIDKVSTGQIVPDWFKRKVPVNFDRIREHQSISNLVQSIKNRIAEFNQKIEQYEREGVDQKVIDNVNNQILGYGSLIYDLENLRTQLGQQTLFGYDVESIEEFNRKKCTNI